MGGGEMTNGDKMNKYQNLRVLSNNSAINNSISEDPVQEIANLIKATGQNRNQRRYLTKKLGKIQTIQRHVQDHVDRSAYKQYAAECDEHMRLFFALLGICLVKNYGKSEDELEELFDMLNAYLAEYQGVPVDDICKIFYELTGIELVSE